MTSSDTTDTGPEPRKARVIDGTAEDVTGGAKAASGAVSGWGRALAVALPVFAFLAGAAVLAGVLWQAGLMSPAARGDEAQRLDAAETRVEALLRDVERLGGDLRSAQEARDALAGRLSQAEAALEATGAQAPDTLARAEDLNAALRLIAEIDGRVGEVESSLEAAPAPVAPARVDALEQTISGITARLEAVQATAARAADADRRIAAIETGIAAVGARQETMAGEIGTLRAQSGAMEARADAAATALATQGEDLETIAARQAEIDTRLAVAEARVDRPEAARRVALGIALANLAGSVAEGKPFASELAAVDALAPDMAGSDDLAAHAATGVAGADALLERFRPAAREALRADAAGEADGWWQRLLGNARALVTVRGTGMREGADTEAVLARTEAALLRDDVAAAVAEAGALEGPAADAMGGWLEAATARARAEALVAGLRTRLIDDLAAAHGPGPGGGTSSGAWGE